MVDKMPKYIISSKKKKHKKDSFSSRLYRSAMFQVLTKIIKPQGYRWIEDAKRPYFEVDMAYTPGIAWRAYIGRKHLIFVPLERIASVKQVHYSFPFTFGIWFHRTVAWQDGRVTHTRFRRIASPFFDRRYDIAKDYLEFKKNVKTKAK